MTITYEEISQHAFQLWLKEGKPEGRELEHWLQSEEELHRESLKKQRGSKITSKDPAMLKPAKHCV